MNDNHFAVVVGIDRYPGVSDLNHARADAENMVTWLRSTDGGGLPADNVVEVMADPDDEPGFTVATAVPTVTQVEDALSDINRRMRERVISDPSAWHSSRLYLYASGHGVAPGSGTAAVLMANVDAHYNVASYGRNIELSLYEEWYRACGVFREALLLADCCRDREFAAEGNGPPWMRCTQPYDTANIALGLATTYGEPAYEPAAGDDGHGYFTQALIDGLRGGAADPATGRITTTSLGEYIARVVPVLTEGKRYPQEPSMLADTAKPIELRPPRGALAPPRRMLTICFPPGFDGEVELFAGLDSTCLRHRVTGAPWTIALAEGLYRISPVEDETVTFVDNGLVEVIAKDRCVQL